MPNQPIDDTTDDPKDTRPAEEQDDLEVRPEDADKVKAGRRGDPCDGGE
jgi:hypothetical protein